ncbi:Redox-sensing transcriptional repressor Rex [Pirellula sp. SH-Sr6A]|uniref:redox-sensing transcriptional repressor Rex n=1 Tax=Pirellula sp. SH-Sr6A TaxID=1632865 RepID=UPI00078E3AAA|nr:redox-sensing transcriptional repressor Rex [Pirellula sp. SH-Sr6A]AMV31877.1 Redox-sensing transcriptional repressor Rex [Pirellula sp. SH-Sr6A]
MFSDATISRLPLYLRELQQLQRGGSTRVQSGVLARRLGLNDSQVRRDLSGFGPMGQRGVGYEIRGLIETIQNALGGNRSWNVILVGVGNLGTALSGYRGFEQQGFQLVGAFDIDPSKIGKNLGKLQIQSFVALEEFVEREKVELAILSVPAASAPTVARRLELVGITGILNFAPVTVTPPQSSVTIVNVDLAVELQRLAYAVLTSKKENE